MSFTRYVGKDKTGVTTNKTIIDNDIRTTISRPSHDSRSDSSSDFC